MKEPKFFRMALILFLWIGYGALYAQHTSPDLSDKVKLELLDHDVAEDDSYYPSFSLKMTNGSTDTIWILKPNANESVPNFFDLVREPDYDFAYASIGVADRKGPAYIRSLTPGEVYTFKVKLDYGIAADESFKKSTVNMHIEYAFDPETDLSRALDWYKEAPSDWSPNAPLRQEMKPYLEKLTPLKIRTKAVTVKTPREK